MPYGIYTRTEEAKKKMSLAKQGKHHTEESRKKMSLNHKGMLGKSHSEATKLKMSISRKGNKNALGNHHSEEAKKKISEEKSYNWKGDKVGYHGVHRWVKKHKPKLKFCEECGENKLLDLANISGSYLTSSPRSPYP